MDLQALVKSIESLTKNVEALHQAVQIIDRKIDNIMLNSGNTKGDSHGSGINNNHLNANNMTPAINQNRTNRHILIDILNAPFSSNPKSERRNLTFKHLNFSGGTCSLQHLSHTINEGNLEELFLSVDDPTLSMPFSEVCSVLGIEPIKEERLSQCSREAIVSLQSLSTVQEKVVQKKLSTWFSSSRCCSIDTSASSCDLPLFKYPQNSKADASGKPDGTCLLLPLKLEIKDSLMSDGTVPRGKLLLLRFVLL